MHFNNNIHSLPYLHSVSLFSKTVLLLILDFIILIIALESFCSSFFLSKPSTSTSMLFLSILFPPSIKHIPSSTCTILFIIHFKAGPCIVYGNRLSKDVNVMVTAAIYSRKSKFTGKGESIQNQIELCKEYAEKNFQVDDFIIYEDEGYSGGHTQRPKYTEMIGDISKGKFCLLICYRLDRISRNISDFSNLVELLQEHNIDFV